MWVIVLCPMAATRTVSTANWFIPLLTVARMMQSMWCVSIMNSVRINKVSAYGAVAYQLPIGECAFVATDLYLWWPHGQQSKCQVTCTRLVNDSAYTYTHQRSVWRYLCVRRCPKRPHLIPKTTSTSYDAWHCSAFPFTESICTGCGWKAWTLSLVVYWESILQLWIRSFWSNEV